jgi:hypothetical protein
MMVQLMAKFPSKSPTEIKEEYNKKAVVGLSELEWTDIVKYLYNDADSEVLRGIVKETMVSISKSGSASSSFTSGSAPETSDVISSSSNGKLVDYITIYIELTNDG